MADQPRPLAVSIGAKVMSFAPLPGRGGFSTLLGPEVRCEIASGACLTHQSQATR